MVIQAIFWESGKWGHLCSKSPTSQVVLPYDCNCGDFVIGISMCHVVQPTESIVALDCISFPQTYNNIRNRESLEVASDARWPVMSLLGIGATLTSDLLLLESVGNIYSNSGHNKKVVNVRKAPYIAGGAQSKIGPGATRNVPRAALPPKGHLHSPLILIEAAAAWEAQMHIKLHMDSVF